MGRYTFLVVFFAYGVVLDLIGLAVWLWDRKHPEEDASEERRDRHPRGVPA